MCIRDRFHGTGFSDHHKLEGSKVGIGDYHNTYFEILFGCGVFTFCIYVYLFVYKPSNFFYKNHLSYFPILLPIIIIPYFENNLTSGQFLFFPFHILFGFTILEIRK